VEANITGPDGTIDLPEPYLARLDFVMAGLHEGSGFDNQGIEKNTGALLGAMANPRIKTIAHSGNPEYPVNLEVLVKGSIATGTALEINNASFSISRKGSRANCDRLADLVARYGAPVIVGSDAHIAQGVGEFGDAVALLEKAGIPAEQVVNSSMERLLSFLGLEDIPDSSDRYVLP